MKALRRLGFVVVICTLVAAIPVSAVASEDVLRSSIGQAESQFDRSLTRAIATGLDADQADQLMWRYSQVTLQRYSWWQAPAVRLHQLDQLTRLQTDLQAAYQQSLSEQRDGFLRAIHHWNQLLDEAQNGGVSVDDLHDLGVRLGGYGAMAATPTEFAETARVVSGETAMLVDRLASFRAARSASQLALQNAQALLASADQYAQLNLAGFQAQIAAAAGDLAGVHSPDGFAPIQDRLQQTALGIQGLLDARSGAYGQLASARNTLASAQSIGAAVGNAPAVIDSLAGQLNSAADQPTFQSILWQLAQQRQALTDAIWQKQQAAYNPGNLGAGKVIIISLSRQVLTAYQDGSSVLSTYITTGRPALPTPPGVYHIFAKYSPYLMVSPWPYGSAFWYPNSWTSWAMEFRGGGYFIHDAPWRSWYGPGSNFYNGTHGCVNVPYSPMHFLWNWTPMGTTVIVQY